MCTCKREKRAMLSESGVRASRSSAVTWVMDHIIRRALGLGSRSLSLCLSLLLQPYIHPATPMATKEKLQEQWNYLYKEYLPTLAKARDKAQTTWPVVLDHCFARIVLDNSIGIDKPWTKVLPSPAYKHMSEAQLRAAIALAERIAAGTANLVELDERSLQLRGKRGKKRRKGQDDGTTAATATTTATTTTNEVQSANTSSPPPPQKKKRKKYETVSSYFLQLPSSPSSSPSSNLAKTANAEDGEHAEPGITRGTTTGTEKNEADVIMSSVQVQRIEDSNMTAFKKQILKMLMQIPRGRYSTYGAMSDHLSTVSSKKTCARAVGSAIKNNPFAPEVCVNVMKLYFSAVQMRRRRMMMIQADNMRA